MEETKKELLDSRNLAIQIAKTVDSKKALDIKLLELKELSSLADYFIICSGGSDTQVKALADEVDRVLSGQGIEPRRVEGYQSANWILMDYGDIIVHIFYRDSRAFYKLDHLWADAPEVAWSGEAAH